jgi:hypothetical protein
VTRLDIGLIVYNALLVVVGYALLFAFGLVRGRRSEWRLLALAYLVGWAFLGCVLTFFLIMGLDPQVATTVVVSMVSIEIAFLIGRRVPKTEVVAHRPRGRPLALVTALAGASALVAAIAVAMIVAIKWTWPAGWDVVWFWLPKANVIFSMHGLDTGVGGWGAQAHPQYPPLASVMAAAACHFAGGFHPSVLTVEAVVLGIAFLGAIPALVDRFAPRWLVFPFMALLAVTPGFWWRLQELIVDQTLAYLVAAAAAACLIWLREPRGAWLTMAIVLLAAATLTKLEGITMALLLVLVVAGGAFAMRGRAGWPALLLLIGPAAIVPWRLWLHSHHFPTTPSDYRVSDLLHPAFLVHHWSLFSFAFQWVLHFVFRPSVWLVALPLGVIAILLAARRVPALAAVVALWIVGACVGVATVYWVNDVSDFGEFIDTTLDRIASTIVIVACTLTPLLLGFALSEAEAAERLAEPSGPEKPHGPQAGQGAIPAPGAA